MYGKAHPSAMRGQHHQLLKLSTSQGHLAVLAIERCPCDMAAPLTDGQVACAQVESLRMGLQALALEGKAGASQRRIA